MASPDRLLLPVRPEKGRFNVRSIRTNLPTRRQNITTKLEYNGQTFFVTMGYGFRAFGQAPQVMEVFGSGARLTSDLDYMVSDACITISLALQHAVTPKMLMKSMNTIPDPINGEDAYKPASVIGYIVQAIIAEEDRLNGKKSPA